MHYGHPDIFDRIFHFTTGGVSKASSGINLSEDIFAGIVSAFLTRSHRLLAHPFSLVPFFQICILICPVLVISASLFLLLF